jgi:predicted dehydrogenase
MADIIRAGIIGTDTSHCVEFTKLFAAEKGPGGEPPVKVTVVCSSFSPDVESSASRHEQYEKTLVEKFGVKLVKTIPELLGEVDAVLIENVDGRQHLPALKQVADAGKPVFIDKPFAASLADAKEMVRIIREKKLPCFSSSSLRFEAGIQKFLAEKDKYGKIQGCDAYSPAELEKTNPGFYWYGVHGVEILYTIMGRGCKTVRCSSTPAGDMAVGIWPDGQIGTMRGIRAGKHDFGASVICEKAVLDLPAGRTFYPGLIAALIKFFQTKQAPVPIEDTLEICAFIDASLRSSSEKCGDVKLEV